MDKANGFSVFFLFAVVSACEHTPGIFITSLNLEGLKGSCLLIPCHFTVNETLNFPAQKSGAVWIQKKSQFKGTNPGFVIYNSTRAGLTNFPMEIIGDVNKRNCTTLFKNLKTTHTEKYFFRVEDGDFKSTASCNAINITVKESAWSPSIEVSGEQRETEVVTITCSAVTPCPREPPTLTMNLEQGTLKAVKNSDGTFNTSITYRLPLTSSHDGYNLTCTAAYPVEENGNLTAVTTITLNVTQMESGRFSAKICLLSLSHWVRRFTSTWFQSE